MVAADTLVGRLVPAADREFVLADVEVSSDADAINDIDAAMGVAEFVKEVNVAITIMLIVNLYSAFCG